MLTNSRKIEKRITKGCPQGSCCGPGYWKILYKSLLNIKFTHQSKAIVYAEDLVFMTTAESILDLGNIMNAALSIISTWARGKSPFQRAKIPSYARDYGEKGKKTKKLKYT